MGLEIIYIIALNLFIAISIGILGGVIFNIIYEHYKFNTDYKNIDRFISKTKNDFDTAIFHERNYYNISCNLSIDDLIDMISSELQLKGDIDKNHNVNVLCKDYIIRTPEISYHNLEVNFKILLSHKNDNDIHNSSVDPKESTIQEPASG